MKCKFCDGSGKDYWGRNGEPYPCPVCNGTGEYEPFDADIELDKLDSEPQTNEEWLRQCSTEELADVLMKIFVTRTFCHLCPEGDVCDIGYKCKYSDGKKIEDWLAWLKEKHE